MPENAREEHIWIGKRVCKEGGDYRFEGDVRSVFFKRSGASRCVVENDDGILHIFNPSQLRTIESK